MLLVFPLTSIGIWVFVRNVEFSSVMNPEHTPRAKPLQTFRKLQSEFVVWGGDSSLVTNGRLWARIVNKQQNLNDQYYFHEDLSRT